jgi:hypothetical protein
VAALNRLMGGEGKTAGGILQYSFPRAERLMDGDGDSADDGHGDRDQLQPTGDGRAAITGDFVLVANEVDPVLRVLRTNGIEVTALHNHMLNDEPRLFFMHFWANDDAAKLARGLRAALDRMNNQRLNSDDGSLGRNRRPPDPTALMQEVEWNMASKRTLTVVAGVGAAALAIAGVAIAQNHEANENRIIGKQRTRHPACSGARGRDERGTRATRVNKQSGASHPKGGRKHAL